jgi:hypothetical protein
VIVSFAGRSISSVNQLKNVLGIYPEGWQVPLVYRREGKRQEILVALRPLHRESELKGPAEPPSRPGRPPGPPDQPPVPDGEEPPPGSPERRPGDAPPLGQRQKVEPPAEWKHLFEARPGFANYYFNRLERDRVLAGLSRFSGLKGYPGRWKLGGTTADGSPFVLTLAEQGAGLKLDEKRVYFQPLDGSDPVDEPPGTGGLLIALEQLKTLLTTGPDAFAECQYVGTEPLDGRGPSVDVVRTLRNGVHVRWFFAPDDGRLVGFDSFLEQDVDPASVRVEELALVGGQLLPRVWTARSGDRVFDRFEVQSAELLPGRSAGQGN